MPNKISAYYKLIKSRIVYLVIVTTATGYYLGQTTTDSFSLFHLFITLLSAGLTCAGVCAFNQVIEWKTDQKMDRTSDRPIPRGDLSPKEGTIFSVVLVSAGLLLMLLFIHWFMALGGLITSVLYLAIYTPLKKITWLNTLVGAIPGALPPLGGWYAATGNLSFSGWALFLILFVWQHPHFYIIAWRFRQDYELSGFKMLPVVEAQGRWTFLQIVGFSVLLIPVSLIPYFQGLVGEIYVGITSLIGVWFLFSAIHVTRYRTDKKSISFLKVTVFYLPLLLLGIFLDRLI